MERGRRNGGVIKHIRTCTGDIFSIAINISQAAATIEGIVADAGHTLGDGDGGQAAATIEGIAADAGHALGDGDGGQASAFIEGIVADAGHAVSNNIFFNLIPKDCFHRRIIFSCCRDDIIAFQSHRGQAVATREGIAADAGHAFRDGDGGQAATT